MKYRFDDIETLNDREGMMASIEEAAKVFISKHPVLQTRATAVAVARLNARELTKEELESLCSLEQIEIFLEEEFLKREKLSYLLNTPKGLKIQEVAKRDAENEHEAWVVCQTWAYMRLHLRITLEQLLGWLNEKFETKEELLGFVEKFNNILWKNDKWGRLVTVAPITREESEDLDLFQSSMPMVVPPRMIGPKHKSPYLRRKTDNWTKKASIRHDELPWEALNIQNHTHYQINWPIWERFKTVIELPKRKEDENDSQFNSRIKSKIRETWKNNFFFAFLKLLGINDIWVNNINDHRSRNYSSQGGAVGLQKQDKDKAIPCFVPEIMTERGEYWLKISIANCYNCAYKGKDLDKHIFEVREQWYNETIAPLMELPEKKFYASIDAMLDGAESPCCFYAQVDNMYKAVQRKKKGLEPMVWCICHMDATCSGYQFQSIFARDLKCAKQVNIHGENERYDLYTIRAHEIDEAGCTLGWGRTPYKKVIWLPFMYGGLGWADELKRQGHERDAEIIIKVAQKYISFGLVDFMRKFDKFIGDKYQMILPDGTLVAKEFNHHSAKTISVLGRDVNVAIQVPGRGINPETGRRYGSNEYLTVVVHSADGWVLRELLYRSALTQDRLNKLLWDIDHPSELSNDPEDRDVYEFKKVKCMMKQFKLYSHRFLWIINKRNAALLTDEDKKVLKMMIGEASKKPYSISCIHDSFGVLPNNIDNLMQNYREVMSDLAMSRWFNCCIDQLSNHKAEFPEQKCPRELWENIRKSKYMLC